MKKTTTDDIRIDEISLEDGKKKKKKQKKPKLKASKRKEPVYGMDYDRETERKSKNRDLIKASYFFVFLFFSLAAYLTYFHVYKAEEINSNVNNTKQDSKEEEIIRGSIYSADGEILAGTNVDAEGNETRLYPFENVFAHVVGYYTNGKSGIESVANYELMSSHASILKQLENESQDIKVRGDSVILTLDSRLQQACYDALGSYKGAVVVMEPSTGKILAMVSKPDFNPNTISEDWDSLVSDSSNSSLFNRAAQGQYPPGSTFKILTTLAYLREHPDDYESYHYNCTGSISKEDVTITCYGGSVHGYEDLAESFLHSCNGSFANIGMELDNEAFKEICEDFGFNADLPITLPSSQSLFKLESGSSYGEEMMTAIGQGDTVVSPLQMALVTSAVANGGVMMEPYLIDRLETYDGDLVKQYRSSKYLEPMTSEEAGIIAGFMTRTVEEGTATALSGQSYTVAGKTGSAEYEIAGDQKSTHSWFVGYSNVSNPDIVVSIIAEDGGSGSSAAVPIAKVIFDAYYAIQ